MSSLSSLKAHFVLQLLFFFSSNLLVHTSMKSVRELALVSGLSDFWESLLRRRACWKILHEFF